jgi:hypothetical protein
MRINPLKPKIDSDEKVGRGYYQTLYLTGGKQSKIYG